MTAEHSSPKSMAKAHGLSKPYTSSDKSFPRRQAAAEEGLSTPTRQHSFPNLPTLLEAERLIKHHLPDLLRQTGAGLEPKRSSLNTLEKNAPHYRPQFPLPGSSWNCFYLIRVGNLSHGVPLSTRKPTIEDQVISSPTLCRKRLGLFPAPNTLARTHTHTQSFPEKSGVWMCV